jgi:hypothetical protein
MVDAQQILVVISNGWKTAAKNGMRSYLLSTILKAV